MKKILYLILTVTTIFAFNSCEENGPEPTGIKYITFEESSKSYVLDQGTTLDATYKIYTSNKVGSDTTLNLSVTGSLDASNYTVPATVTMLANSNEAIVNVQIIENNFDQINGETLSITLDSPSNYFTGSTTLDIKVDVFCPSQIEGAYVYGDGNGKPVTVTVDSGINNFVVSGGNFFTDRKSVV